MEIGIENQSLILNLIPDFEAGDGGGGQCMESTRAGG